MNNDDYTTTVLLDLDTIDDIIRDINYRLGEIEDIRRRIKEYVKQIE